jgi:hypothetical protein
MENSLRPLFSRNPFFLVDIDEGAAVRYQASRTAILTTEDQPLCGTSRQNAPG